MNKWKTGGVDFLESIGCERGYLIADRIKDIASLFRGQILQEKAVWRQARGLSDKGVWRM